MSSLGHMTSFPECSPRNRSSGPITTLTRTRWTWERARNHRKVLEKCRRMTILNNKRQGVWKAISWLRGYPSEIYDASSYNVPIQWHWHPDFEVQNGAIKAFFVVNVPENETPESRTISAQISIDNNWNEGYHIEEEDEHDWGEWITILSGIQDGK